MNFKSNELEALIAETYELMSHKNFSEAYRLVELNPQILNVADNRGSTLLHDAARLGNEECFFYFLEKGAVFNEGQLASDDLLSYAVLFGTPRMVKITIDFGLDPNHDRTIFSAIRNSKGLAIEILQVMLDHGLELNRVFAMFGDRDNAKTALDYAGGDETKIGQFLRSKGGKTAAEVLAENPDAVVIGAEN